MDHRMPFQAWGVASIMRGLKLSTLRPQSKRNTLPDGTSRIQPGDRLLVCEPLVREPRKLPLFGPPRTFGPVYDADGAEADGPWRWKASRLAGMYLPTDLVRYAVTVESVEPRMSASELTDAEIARDGVYQTNRCPSAGYWCEWHGGECAYPTHRDAFRALWEGIHGAGSFEARTPLWLYGFKDVEEVRR